MSIVNVLENNQDKYFIRGKDMQFLASKKSENKSDDSDTGSSAETDDIPF